MDFRWSLCPGYSHGALSCTRTACALVCPCVPPSPSVADGRPGPAARSTRLRHGSSIRRRSTSKQGLPWGPSFFEGCPAASWEPVRSFCRIPTFMISRGLAVAAAAVVDAFVVIGVVVVDFFWGRGIGVRQPTSSDATSPAGLKTNPCSKGVWDARPWPQHPLSGVPSLQKQRQQAIVGRASDAPGEKATESVSGSSAGPPLGQRKIQLHQFTLVHRSAMTVCVGFFFFSKLNMEMTRV